MWSIYTKSKKLSLLFVYLWKRNKYRYKMSRVILIVLLVLFVIFSLKSPEARRRPRFYPYNHCQPSPCYPCHPHVRRCSPCCEHHSVIQLPKRSMNIPGNNNEFNTNVEETIKVITDDSNHGNRNEEKTFKMILK